MMVVWPSAMVRSLAVPPVVHRAGSNRVDAHPAWAELSRPRLGQRFHGRLGGAVTGATSEADARRHAADVDDAAASAVGHRWREGRYQEVRGPHVTGEQGIELVLPQLRRRPEPGDTRVVHQHVHHADRRGQLLRTGWFAEIGSREAGLTTCGRDRIHDSLAAPGVAAVHCHCCPPASQFLRSCPAQA